MDEEESLQGSPSKRVGFTTVVPFGDNGITDESAASRIQARFWDKSSRTRLMEEARAKANILESTRGKMGEFAAAKKIQALVRGRRARRPTITLTDANDERLREEKRIAAAEKAAIDAAVKQKSKFNGGEAKRDRGWFYEALIHKPTRLFIFDVAYRAIYLDKKAFPHFRRWVLIPSGYWRVAYAYLVLFVALADVLLCSTAISYCRQVYYGPLNIAISLLFLLDMALSFLTAYPTKDASLEMRPKYIAIRYLRTSFLLHLPGLLPLELAGESSPRLMAWQYVRVLRFFHVWLRHDSFRSVTSTSNDGILDAFKYFILTAMVAHCCSCVFFSLAVVDSPVCMINPSTGWLTPLDDEQVSAAIEVHNEYDYTSFIPLADETWRMVSNVYIYYLYATVAMLLGDGGAAKTRNTQAVSVIILVVGNITFSVVFSKIILALQAQTAARDAYASKMLAVNDAMESQGVAKHLQRRVRRFFEFKFMLMAGLDDPATSYICELPNAMRVDIMTSLYSGMLNEVPLFKGCSTSVISSLAQQLRTHLILPDEIVIKEGCVGNSMYLCVHGLLTPAPLASLASSLTCLV